MSKLEQKRIKTYCLVAISITVFYILLHKNQWQSDAQIHILMEVVATLLAGLVGLLALVRFHAHNDKTFLLIGTGFLGAAFLDGYHAVVTARYLSPLMPSDLPSNIPWSWLLSRQFLATMLLCSWLVSRHERTVDHPVKINQQFVYLSSALFILACYLFFIMVPLPDAYYPELLIHRPAELAPAFILLLALLGYLYKGSWRTDSFDHWLVLSLIIGLLGQALVMPFSSQLFDFEFNFAHILKKVSYLCVLVGLLINIYKIDRKEDENRQYLKSVVDNIHDGIVTINHLGIIQSANPAVLKLFDYTSEQLVGHNVNCLIPEPEKSRHDQIISDYLITKKAKIIGIGREVKAIKHNGDIFSIELQISQFTINDSIIFLGTIRDITRQKEVDKAKGEFISTVSHELRTPLTSIRASLGIMASGKVGALPEKVARLTTIAKDNTERLITLVNDILDIEKMQSNKMVFEFSTLSILEVVETCLEINHPLTDKFDIEFVLQASPEKINIKGDKSRLIQVMNNLLSNAAKYSPKKGMVTISTTQLPGLVRVSISDQGPGVPKEFYPHIFGRFKQADSSDTRKVGGTGLGLNISQEIIKRHGGHIDFEREEGKGAVFYFELPVV